MNKKLKLITATTMLTGLLFSFNVTKPQAAVVDETGGSASGCTQTNYGLICNDNIQKEYIQAVYFSKSEVATIVNNWNKATSTKEGVAMQFVVGLVPYASWGVLAYNLGGLDMISKFQTAKSKGTGLNWYYKVTVYKTTNVTKVSNETWVYK